MNKAIIHVRCNAGKIKRVKRDGRNTIVLPSYAAKANTVLNGILYPEDELDKSIAGLNRTPAPLGHPTINGKFVPALDPEALARNHVFAWNENPRWDGDRIALDVVIDEARASESEGGREVLNAIEKQQPISTSTGLFCNLEKTNAEDHKSIARDITWDHVAILLNEAPAISPEEGVGIFVNSAGSEEEIPVINSVFEDADRDMDWALQSLASAIERRNRAGVLDQLKSLIIEAYDRLKGSEKGKPQPHKEDDMSVSKEQFEALSATVNTLKETVEGQAKTMAETIANALKDGLKPITDAHAEAVANAAAKEEAEKAELVGKVVKANLLTEEAAKATPLNTLRELGKIAAPKGAAPLAGGDPKVNADDEFAGYDINALMETK